MILLSSLAGCSVFNNRSVRFVGGTDNLAECETPAGFAISPQEASDIINRHRKYPHIFADNIYHDDDNYYLVTVAGFKNGSSSAVKWGTIINGQTGEVFNRETQTWEAVPERRNRLSPPIDANSSGSAL